MAAFTRVNPGDPMQAHQLNQVIDALDGAVGAGVPIAVTAVNDATNYAVAIQNDDATNSRALLVQKQDGTTLIQADVNGVVLALANGSVHNAALASDVARANQLVNGGFDVWSRGVGPFTATGAYNADRWRVDLAGTDTMSVSKDTTNFDVGSLACAACTFVLGTGAGTSILSQVLRIADGHQLAGRTINLSARVRTSTASAVRVALVSDGTAGTTVFSTFHTGGGTYQTLTATYSVPSNATYVQVLHYFAVSCTAYIDNAMLVVGSQPADYVPLHPADDLARCLRYYEQIGSPAASDTVIGGYAAAASQGYNLNASFRAPKAVTPTVTKVGTWTVVNTAQPSVTSPTVLGFRAFILSLAAGSESALNDTATSQFTAEANP